MTDRIITGVSCWPQMLSRTLCERYLVPEQETISHEDNQFVLQIDAFRCRVPGDIVNAPAPEQAREAFLFLAWLQGITPRNPRASMFRLIPRCLGKSIVRSSAPNKTREKRSPFRRHLIGRLSCRGHRDRTARRIGTGVRRDGTGTRGAPHPSHIVSRCDNSLGGWPTNESCIELGGAPRTRQHLRSKLAEAPPCSRASSDPICGPLCRGPLGMSLSSFP